MDEKLKRYFRLKRKQRELEQELGQLRGDIIAECEGQGVSELRAGGYRAKLVLQERKEYDDAKLYEALPDPDVWRLMSRADAAKIAGLIKLNVITEEKIKDSFEVRNVTLLQVDKL